MLSSLIINFLSLNNMDSEALLIIYNKYQFLIFLSKILFFQYNLYNFF